MEPVQDRGWHPRAELRVAIERVTDEVQGTHLLAYHLLVVEELQQVKVCDSHTELVWEDGQSANEHVGLPHMRHITRRNRMDHLKAGLRPTAGTSTD